jgi:LuxR family transcriptional regulator, maltose regulon positive regulatory protein
VARPFRFSAPTLPSHALTRPRLLRDLAGRWERRLTLVVGGAGFGKTTLLAQAMAENRLAPRGLDVWLGLEPDDSAGVTLATDLARALDPGHTHDGAVPTATWLADTVWAMAPSPVAVILDDVHLLEPGSAGVELVVSLLDLLPSNGHLVLASRTTPPIPFARLAAHGEVVRIVEDDLRFDEHELGWFTRARGVDLDVVASSGGWPAMAELGAVADTQLATDFLWQEILEPLGDRARRVLAVVIELGGGDDALVSECLGEPIGLAEELGAVPLIADDGAGRFVPHQLWSTVAAVRLDPAEASAVRRAAGIFLARSEQFVDAFESLAGAQAWDLVENLLGEVCRGESRVGATTLHEWITECPPEVMASPNGLLAFGVHARFTDPSAAIGPLRAAVEAFRSAGDIDGELSAVSHLGHAAWWAQDLSILAEIFPHVAALASDGHLAAIGLLAVGRSLIADVKGDDEAMIAEVRSAPPGSLAGRWPPVAAWIEGAARVGRGEIDEPISLVTEALDGADPMFRLTLQVLVLQAQWYRGEIDEVLVESSSVAHRVAEVGIAHNVAGVGAQAAACHAIVGDVDTARRLLEMAERFAQVAGDASQVRLAITAALVAVAEGDEVLATQRLIEANERYPFETGMPRRAWRTAIATIYVLVEALRPAIDAMELTGVFVMHRRWGHAVVAARAGDVPDVDRLTGADIDLLRAALPVRHVAELAVALAETGRADAITLFDALGEPGRAAARDLSERGPRRAKAVRLLFGRVPAAPRETTAIRLLGPFEVQRGDHVADDTALRRDRVRALMALLTVRPVITRTEAAALLWPDFDDEKAANNLRVNLSHLERVLEPQRSPGEPAWSIRRDGDRLRLVTGPTVRLDTADFTTEIEVARQAERDAAPSVALDRLLAAVGMWRGEPFTGVPDAEWLDLPREHLRSSFVAAGLRAGELLLGRGDADDADDADELARRVLDIDPFSERAHGLLAAALLDRGDRSGARRALDRCHAMLDELGIAPSPATLALARRIRSG